MSHNSDQNRQPPRFVPTLTEMVRAPAPALAMGQAVSPPVLASPDAGMPAAFADLLKDWPTLGESLAAESVPQKAVAPDPVAEQLSHNTAEQIAIRAEALVMQRLPAALAGLVAQAVRDALREPENAAKRQTPKS